MNTTNTTNTTITTMRKEMSEALRQINARPNPPVIVELAVLLGQAQQAIYENGFSHAVLELRQDVPSYLGLRFAVYVRDNRTQREQYLFTVFVDNDVYAFESRGQVQSNLDSQAVLDLARYHLLGASTVEFISATLQRP